MRDVSHHAIELAWRPDVLRDPAVGAVKDAVLAVFAAMKWVSHSKQR